MSLASTRRHLAVHRRRFTRPSRPRHPLVLLLAPRHSSRPASLALLLAPSPLLRAASRGTPSSRAPPRAPPSRARHCRRLPLVRAVPRASASSARRFSRPAFFSRPALLSRSSSGPRPRASQSRGALVPACRSALALFTPSPRLRLVVAPVSPHASSRPTSSRPTRRRRAVVSSRPCVAPSPRRRRALVASRRRARASSLRLVALASSSHCPRALASPCRVGCRVRAARRRAFSRLSVAPTCLADAPFASCLRVGASRLRACVSRRRAVLALFSPVTPLPPRARARSLYLLARPLPSRCLSSSRRCGVLVRFSRLRCTLAPVLGLHNNVYVTL
ncbi:hypothetical protein DENSPDRAFT_933707 [Dentipellis sp. KUC8613]|nr:hypothetical protein DENSPDRAFT_933707 [Dentipellis sp. KUC8613]